MKHLMKKAPLALGMFLCANLLGACSLKSSGGGSGGGNPKPDPFSGKPRVQGPAIEGAWTSACYTTAYESSKWKLQFTGDKFERSQENFSDTKCQTSKEKSHFIGSFIFSLQFPDGSYEINYAADLGSGWTQFLDEKLFLEGETLYFSNLVTGEGAPLIRRAPFKKDGSETTKPTPNPTPVPAPIPSSCQNYSGRYQMNSSLFEITQKDCTQIKWETQPTYYNPQGKVVNYIPDGIEREYDTNKMKVSFEKGLLKFEYQMSSHLVVEVWSFQKRPCHLSNPSGSDYLTRNVWVDGKEDSGRCSFYSKFN